MLSLSYCNIFLLFSNGREKQIVNEKERENMRSQKGFKILVAAYEKIKEQNC